MAESMTSRVDEGAIPEDDEHEIHVDSGGNVVHPEESEDDSVSHDEESEDERQVSSSDSDDEPHDEDDDERAARQDRNRQWNKEKRERRKRAEENLRRELEYLRAKNVENEQRLASIERKSTGAELAQLDNAIREMASNYAFFKDRIALASQAGDHAGLADATEKMIVARNEHENLMSLKNTYAQKQNQASPLDMRVSSLATQWVKKNPWYDPQRRDLDSKIASDIDVDLHNSGWDPALPEFWDELDRRVSTYLPHRSRQTSRSQSTTRKAPPVTGSQRERSSGKAAYTLSSDRVQAMKDAGMWDDPKKRSAAIKQYQEYDKQSKE